MEAKRWHIEVYLFGATVGNLEGYIRGDTHAAAVISAKGVE